MEEGCIVSAQREEEFFQSIYYFLEQLLYHEEVPYRNEEIQKYFYSSLKAQFIELFLLLCAGSTKELLSKEEELLKAINQKPSSREKQLLQLTLAFIKSIVKTNFFVEGRNSLAYRLDPGFYDLLSKDVKKIFPSRPYALFFFYSKIFCGFHIRFQDLARGGLRTIYCANKKDQDRERLGIFRECYELALTQHKKNKDIPEGGAKAVLFVEAIMKKGCSDEDRIEHLHDAQKRFIQDFLSLIHVDQKRLTKSGIVNLLHTQEYIYLGPDENLHDTIIEWIARYSVEVGYTLGGAFITGRPFIGINHKKYGVTSHGVNTCLSTVLRYLDINPTTTDFSIKMSGGPDGDVAGNQICCLKRSFQEHAKLLLIIDISGVIYDPKGLNMAILEELFYQQNPIRNYPIQHLSEGGWLLDLFLKKEEANEEKVPLYLIENEKIKEEWVGKEVIDEKLAAVHKVRTDIFIPAGGRPYTLQENTMYQCIDKQNVPNVQVIIEGANIYLNQKARHFLEDYGVIIIKDSSANKGGVISSSFEVLSSLLLSEEEFLQFREQIAREILKKIGYYAKKETECILKEHKKKKEYCSVISDTIAERINALSDEIRDALQIVTLNMDPKDQYNQKLFEYVLPLFKNSYSDRVLSKLSDLHKKSIIASWVASEYIYKHGVSKTFRASEVIDEMIFGYKK